MSFYRQYREELILAVILIISAAMRFYNYAGWSLSNDELSAVYGISLGSFDRMIEEYVRPDFHPAGVQAIMYWWSGIFGISEASLRFPFVVAGVLSVLLVYLVAARWFNKTTGLFAALTISFLGYTILYSQLARPYSFGLLFSLMTVYFWTRILFDEPGRKQLLSGIGWMLSLTACMYTHYFSFLFAIIVGATGLLYIKKHNYLTYLLPAAVAVALFLPHLSISLEQFGRGGLSTWLGKPGPGYFIEYLFYSFNNSVLLCTVAGLIALISIVTHLTSIKQNKFRWIALIWFIVPFLIGYFYSVYINPVLQYSILIFSFPFLLIFLFSFFDPKKWKLNFTLLGALAVIGIYSTTAEKKFYSTQVFGVFKEVAEKTVEWNEKYGKHNITHTVNVIHPTYIHYYLDRYDNQGGYLIYDISNRQQLGRLAGIVDSTDTEYFMYGWSNNGSPYEIYEIIKQKYPIVVEDQRYFNSAVTLFQKGPARKALTYTGTGFEKEDKNRLTDSTFLVQQPVHSGQYAYRMDSLVEFSPTIETTAGELYKDSKFLVLSFWGYHNDNPNAQLVLSFEGEVKDWSSVILGNFTGPGSWGQAVLVRKLPEGILPGDPVKIYVWNPDKKTVYIDDIRIAAYADSDYHY